MADVEFFWVDAFAEAAFSGNPAVVCVMREAIETDVLQAAAREFNVSESVFISGAEGRYGIRWFTPTRELPLVGHATLAAAHIVTTEIEPGRSTLTFTSHLSGALPAFREGDRVAITLPADELSPVAPPEALVLGLGLRPVETWLGRHYVAVLESADAVRAVRPVFESLATLDRPTIAVTAPGIECDYVLRFFAPANGVPEDPVSGVAQCSLVPLWAKRTGRSLLRSEQLSERGGTMDCRLTEEGVVVSGPCRTLVRGTLALPR